MGHLKCLLTVNIVFISKAPAKENVIQVMTAERREYSRPKGKFDVSMSMPPPNFNMSNEPFYPEDNFSYGYEPTQEQQWNDNVQVGWMPSGELQIFSKILQQITIDYGFLFNRN